MTKQYHDMGLEHLFMEPDDPYEVSFSNLFKRKDRLSMAELAIQLIDLPRLQDKKLPEGTIYFYELFYKSTLKKTPHYKPFIQKAIGHLTSKEYKVIMLIFLEEYSESQVAKEMQVTRRTIRTYKDRALRKIFKELPKQKINSDNIEWTSNIVLFH